MTERNNKSASYSSLKGFHRAVPIILYALAAFTLLCFLSVDMGIFGNAISNLFSGLFSHGAYALPLLICLHAIFYPSDIAEKRILSRVIFSLITLIAVSSLAYAITYWNDELVFNASDFYNNGKAFIGGGFIGSTVGYALIKAFSKIGLVIITVATFAIYVSYFFAKGQRSISKVFIIILRILVVLCEMFCNMISSLFGKVKNAKSEKDKRTTEQKSLELTEDEFFGVDNGMQRLNIPELGIRESRTSEDLEVNPTLQNKVFHKSVVSTEEAEEMEEREMLERAAEMFAQDQAKNTDNTDQNQRRRIVNVNYGDLGTEIQKNNAKQDIIIENTSKENANETPASPITDESADAIFTHDFDPFGMMMSEELASKPSSRSLLDEMPASRTLKEDISEMTEAELERMKRLEEFEKKKSALINSRKAVPVNNDGEFTGTPKNVEFRERNAELLGGINEEEHSVSVKFEKNTELPKAEPARYTSIGYDENNTAINQNAFTKPETIYFHEEPTETVYERPAPVQTYQEAPKAPVYEAPAQTYQEAPKAPVYEAPAQTYQEAPKAPVYETPAQTYQEAPKAPVYEAPAQTYQEAPKAPVYETPTQTSDYDEEPLIPIYERPSPVQTPQEAPKAPVYEVPVQNFVETPQAPVNEVPSQNYVETPQAPIQTYKEHTDNTNSLTGNGYIASSNANDVQNTDYVPEFKPYEPTASVEINENRNNEDNEESENVTTLKIERSLVNDENTLTFNTQNEEINNFEEFNNDEEEFNDDEEEEFKDDSFNEEDVEEANAGFNTTEIPPEEQNPVVQGYKDMFPALRDEEDEDEEDTQNDYQLVSPDEIEDNANEDQNNNNDDEDEDENEDEPPFEATRVPQREKNEVKAKPEPKTEEKKKPDYTNYQIPPIDLLGLDLAVDDDNSEITENTNILIDTLASFNVTASIKGVDRGPRITRYEVVPARGVKVQAITSLYNDITLYLEKEGVRMEAPIPGKSAVGFEIPNKHPKNVRLRELLECEEFMNAKSKTFVSIGKDVAGNPVFGDISKYPHALICGATGMGKSVCINSILVSMLYKARPDEVKFIMIDPKKVEFKIYSGIPHLLIPVITESKQAAGALMWAVEEMERRYEIIEQNNIRNIEAYNEKVAANPSLGDPLPKIVIVIDELADLMMQVRDPVEDLIMRIAQKARAAGIHLIIGTQRPSVQVITGAIKANIPSRISCKVTSQIDSRTIFDVGGAEKLLNRGDMLYWPVDRTAPLRVQGAFVSDGEVEAIMNFLKSSGDTNQYDDQVMAEINKAAQKCGNNKKGGGVSADDIEDDDQECGYYSDQQFLDAVDLAIRSKKISTSLLQRKLSIGYGKAAKYIDAMEDIGVVSEPKGQKPRDVLITMDEWHERLSRVDYDS